MLAHRAARDPGRPSLECDRVVPGYTEVDDRDAFLAHRERLVDLVVRMGEALDQADVFILAYDSDSLLIEVAERTH